MTLVDIQDEKRFEKYKPNISDKIKSIFDTIMVKVVKGAILDKASDIFFVTWEPPVVESSWECNKILIAKNNTDSWTPEYLRISDEFVLHHFFKFVSEKVMSFEYQQELFETQFYTDLSGVVEGQRFRINVAKQQGHFTITMRLISAVIPDIDQIWLPLPFKSVLNNSQWLILVVWPTGSWKSSSLASMIDFINNNPKKKKHIITLEDPIEYQYKSNYCLIEQKEMYQDIKTFAWGIRAALRQHPDIILVWEMRDPETIEMALKAWETWHLVFSTMHTNSAVNTISKVLNNFEGVKQWQVREELADILTAIFVQRLLPKKAAPGEKAGKILCLEICLVDDAIRNQIRTGGFLSIETSIQMSRDKWMILFDDYLLELYKKNIITKETVVEFSRKKELSIKKMSEIIQNKS